MPARVYSERFLHKIVGAGGSETYTVPAGKRAVVRSVALATYTVAVTQLYVGIDGVAIFNLANPAANTSKQLDVRVVVYQGQQIYANSVGGDAAWSVSGHLFDEL